MEDKYINWADIKGVRYPLCLSIGSAETLEKEFGTVTGAIQCIWGHVEQDNVSALMADTLRIAAPLAEAGKAYIQASAIMAGTTAKEIPELPSAEILAVALSANEILDLWNACYKAMRVGQTREVEVAQDNDPKNAGNAM